jgi:hypothetical protein
MFVHRQKGKIKYVDEQNLKIFQKCDGIGKPINVYLLLELLNFPSKVLIFFFQIWYIGANCLSFQY